MILLSHTCKENGDIKEKSNKQKEQIYRDISILLDAWWGK